MSHSDLEYYAQRHARELELAIAAASAEAASAHRMLAEIYLSEVKRLAAAPAILPKPLRRQQAHRAAG